MDLSQLQIQARQRSPWEAVDLGFVVARQWFKPLLLVWAIPSLALFFLMNLVFWESPWVAVLVVWWLKPLFDRLPLQIASRRLFGGTASVGETLKSMLKLFWPQWFLSLTWRRFSPTRSHDMPITCLEKLKGSQRSRRLSVMHMSTGTPALWLTVLGLIIELCFAWALAYLIFWFVPQNVQINIWPWVADGSLWFQRILFFLLLVVASLVAPFYCMAGFMLYISRRIDLEAWDLEIKFRNLVQTREKARLIPVALVTILLNAFFIADSNRAYAQEPLGEERTYLSLEESRELAEEILEGEEFYRTREVTGWRFKEEEKEEEVDDEPPGWLERFFDWLDDLFEGSGIGGFLSGLNLVAKVLLISLALVAVAWVVLLIARTSGNPVMFSSKKKQEPEKPEVLFGLDVRPEKMPENVSEHVRQLCEKGDIRGALSLLYGALLSKLIHEYGFRFYDGHTEWECAQIVSRSSEQELKDFMLDATLLWQKTAYAKLLPKQQDVIGLCDQWESLFDE